MFNAQKKIYFPNPMIQKPRESEEPLKKKIFCPICDPSKKKQKKTKKKQDPMVCYHTKRIVEVRVSP